MTKDTQQAAKQETASARAVSKAYQNVRAPFPATQMPDGHITPCCAVHDAAPDLLAACRDALSCLSGPGVSLDGAKDYLRAAIAKAEGR